MPEFKRYSPRDVLVPIQSRYDQLVLAVQRASDLTRGAAEHLVARITNAQADALLAAADRGVAQRLVRSFQKQPRPIPQPNGDE